MNNKLLEVRITENASNCFFSDRPATLDSLSNYPDRFRFTKFWVNDDKTISPVGGAGRFTPNEYGFFDFMGHVAMVMGVINPDRYMEADWFDYK